MLQMHLCHAMRQILNIFPRVVLVNRQDVSVATSTTILKYKNNSHSIRDTRWRMAGQSPTSPRGSSDRVQTQSSPYGICDRLIGLDQGFPP